MNNCRLVFAYLLGVTALAGTSPAAAQTVVAPPNVTAGDVVTTPLSDLNLKKNEIPPILLAARERPYDLTGVRTCKAIQSEIVQLDGALGDDIDVALEKTRDEKRGNSVGSVAKSVLSSYIPVHGVIREVSGAAANERQWQVALYAGASRRAFLKGYGQARGCRYPARAATATQAAAIRAAAARETDGSPQDSAPPAAHIKPRKPATARRR